MTEPGTSTGGGAEQAPAPPPGPAARREAPSPERPRVDADGFTDDCSGHPLPAAPAAARPSPAAPRPAPPAAPATEAAPAAHAKAPAAAAAPAAAPRAPTVAAAASASAVAPAAPAGAGEGRAARIRRLLVVALPTAAVLAVAGTMTSRLLFRGSAEAHQAPRTPRVMPPVGIRAPAAPRLTEEAVRAAAEYLSLDEVREGDPPSAVISGQEVDPGSTIQVEGDPPIDFRIAAIERALVRLVVDATDPPTEIELVLKR